MSFPIRNSVRVLLINDKKEILLICAEDYKTTTIDGKYRGRYWYTIGGKIESNESVQEAAIREIYEETGIIKEELELGPIVWFGEYDLILSSIKTHNKQQFMVVKTPRNNVTLDYLTPEEKVVIKDISWFSLEKIKNSSEIIYPIVLPDYLGDILDEKYPEKPFEIDLAKNHF